MQINCRSYSLTKWSVDVLMNRSIWRSKMKNRIRTLAALVLSVIMVMTLMTGCSSKPKAEDAKAYVQAVLDLLCTGDYDHSVKLADVEEGSEGALRDELYDTVINQLSAQVNLDEEAKTAAKDFMTKALSLAKYEVVDAVPTEGEEGGYDVTVSVEPLKLYEGAAEEFQAQLPDILGYSYAELGAMTEDQVNNIMFKALFKFVSDRLDNPVYGDPVEVTVHYGLLDEEENMYGCDEAAGEKLGSAIFDVTGL